MSSQGGRGGQKLPILPSKKTTKRGGGGQKSPILRRHSLWTAPNTKSIMEHIVCIVLLLLCHAELWKAKL